MLRSDTAAERGGSYDEADGRLSNVIASFSVIQLYFNGVFS